MLSTLTIQNVVLIERLSIDFRAGLCALTGETGAGKSILLDSLGLAMGARAESRLVRKGADMAVVTAVFELNNIVSSSRAQSRDLTKRDNEKIPPLPTVGRNDVLFNLLQNANITIEAGEPVILKRTLSADGRSRAFINDQPVSVGLLQQVGESLVEIHGQFDTQGLLNPSTHRQMLDDYAGLDGAVCGFWEDWKRAEADVSRLRQSTQQSRADEQYLRESLEDIDRLAPQAGEEKTLSELKERLRFKEQALKALNDAHMTLNGDKDPVSKALGMLESMAGKLPEGAGRAIDALDRAGNEIAEAVTVIQSLREDLWHEDHNLEDVDDRLHALRIQARKHDCAVDDLPEKREELARRLNEIEHADEILAAAMKAADAARRAYMRQAEQDSAARRSAGARLDALVQAELAPLKLEKARFVTDVQSLAESEWGVHGMDRVRFLVATNPGAEAGPLNKIASGGEMARFMLALKVVMAQVGMACTMVFDEVDAGVGGAVADAVGERLARLAAEGKQVMVVTHAPQIAARAATHYIVRKDGEAQVNTNVVQLSEAAERREEIARMLAGATITEEARAAAEKLMEVG